MQIITQQDVDGWHARLTQDGTVISEAVADSQNESIGKLMQISWWRLGMQCPKTEFPAAAAEAAQEEASREKMAALIKSPEFHHISARGTGTMAGLIAYRSDPTSPTGVIAACGLSDTPKNRAFIATQGQVVCMGGMMGNHPGF